MRLLKISLLCTSIIVLTGTIAFAQNSIADFRLKNTTGQWVSLKEYPEAKGFIIVFISNHCPFAKQYPDRLNKLNKKYGPLGIPLIAISSTDTLMFAEDTYEKMITIAKLKNYNFPYLYDNTQVVGKNFGAKKTPHAFVIWKEHDLWNIQYNGSIDDNGAEPEKVIHAYVEDAVESLLAGKRITIRETKSIGCQIHYRN